MENENARLLIALKEHKSDTGKSYKQNKTADLTAQLKMIIDENKRLKSENDRLGRDNRPVKGVRAASKPAKAAESAP